METNSKHRFIPRLLAVMMFLSSSFTVIGQDLIRGAIDYLICDTSIVRGIAKDTTLIYNRINSYRGNGSTFSLVVAGNPIAQLMSLDEDSIFVNDFEFFKRNVYFCGFIRESGYKKAVIGYFKFNPFPNTDIYYYEVLGCNELYKLDIYAIEEMQNSEEIHLVATGTSSNSRSDVLVDMNMEFSVPTNCNIYFSQNENENYDDVAVTKKYIVVSSRNKVQGFPVVDFWFYRKPNHIWQSIFSSNVNRLRINAPMPESPVILEHTRLDSVAAVYKIAGFSEIAMLRLEATSLNYKVLEIVEDTIEKIYPIDIKYNKIDSVYSILARAKDMQHLPPYAPYMQIYHITPGDLLGTTSIGQGKKYTTIFYKLWSLDFWYGANRQFVVSGGAGQIPKLFRFNLSQENTCSERFVFPRYRGELKGVFNEITISPYSIYLSRYKKETGEWQIPFPVECGKE